MGQDAPSPISVTVDEQVKRIFETFDANGDGKISITELAAVLNNLGSEISEEDLSRVMPILDTDGDGFIDFEEFKAFLSKDSDGGGGDSTKELKEAFDLYDKDGNGKISDVELHSVLRSLGRKCTLQDCQRMIGAVDIDGDGCVNFEEFQVVMSSNRDSSVGGIRNSV